LLAGIVTKASGIFPLIVLSAFVFGFERQLSSVIMAVGAISIVSGALAALWQTEQKRILAYSSISQMGYIVLALGVGTNLGFVAALFHFFNHALFKAQLFANVAAVESQVGERPVDELGGLAQAMPITGVTSMIAALSTAGLPPLSGFWSKLLVVMALWLSGHYAYAFIAVLASVITLAYFLRLQRKVFFGQLLPELSKVREAGWLLLSPAVLLALLTVGVGLVVPFMINGLMR
jgi:multicomponent Na+:H+ antiporter subunit D